MEQQEKKRTEAQNNAMHLWFTQLADALNLAGWDMKKVIRVDIPWSPYSIKENLWRPLQNAMFGKDSTTQLTTDEVTKIYEVINREIGNRTGVTIPFPSIEELFAQMELEQTYGKNNTRGENPPKIN